MPADRIPEYDLFPTVQRYADELRRSKCDLVVALTHIGYEEHNPGDITDIVLCRNTRNIDLFVGGHSHTFLQEAKMHPNKDGKMIPIAGRLLGRKCGPGGRYLLAFYFLTNSTRLLRARPSSVPLLAMGSCEPLPTALSFSAGIP